MLKKIIIALSVFITLSAVSVFLFFWQGKKSDDTLSSLDADTIAIVNGEQIKMEQLEKSRKLQTFVITQTRLQIDVNPNTIDSKTASLINESITPKTDKELLDKIISRTVLRQDIKKQNITVTQVEIDKSVSSTIKLLEDAKSSPYYQSFLDTMDYLGYTFEQYKTELAPLSAKETLESTKYYENFKSRLIAKEPDITLNQIKQRYGDYIKKLVEDADVKILIDLK